MATMTYCSISIELFVIRIKKAAEIDHSNKKKGNKIEITYHNSNAHVPSCTVNYNTITLDTFNEY